MMFAHISIIFIANHILQNNWALEDKLVSFLFCFSDLREAMCEVQPGF